jgi:hypothetical protein
MHLGAQRSVHDLLIGPPHYAFFNLQNAALFFLPLLVLCARVRPQRSVTIVIGLVFIAIAIHLMAIGRLLPYFNGGNVFADLGLGPQTLRDVFTFRMAYPRHLGQPTRIVLMAVSTAAAIFLAAVVVAVAAGRFRFASARAELVARYGAIYCLAGTVLIAVMRIYFDRYSIDTLWPVAIVLPLLAATRPISRRRIAAAAVALTLVASFAIIETAEYLAWNRARWQAFAFLRANGVTLQQMDGGYEINAMLALQTGRKSLGKPGFAVVDDRYIIAFNQVPGYTTLRAFPFPRVLGLRTGYVYAEARK